jgi:hypothetical protein
MTPRLSRFAPAAAVVFLSLIAASQPQQSVQCQPQLVHCNYAHHYSGTIRIVTVDTVGSTDHRVRNDGDVLITVRNGVAVCIGQFQESEKKGYRGRFESEMTGRGSSSGPGLVSIEFEVTGGRLSYVLTAVCPTPRMIRTSFDLLNGGSTQVDTVAAEPADWRNAGQLADPQPATSQGMTPIGGSQRFSETDPDNAAGGSKIVTWTLTR